VAWPPERATWLIGLPSRANVTLPVGVPDPGLSAVTVAVNVTDWPYTEGLTDEPSWVVLESWATVWSGVSVALEAVKSVLPP
jgi:hypothetical protein